MSLSLVPGSWLTTKGYRLVIAVIAKVIAELEHLDDQERKRKRDVEQKEQLKKWKEKGKNEKGNEGRRKDKSNKREIPRKINEMQNWIQNQFWFASEFQRKIKGKWKEKQRKGNKGIQNSN